MMQDSFTYLEEMIPGKIDLFCEVRFWTWLAPFVKDVEGSIWYVGFAGRLCICCLFNDGSCDFDKGI